jgi:hypothetical protein
VYSLDLLGVAASGRSGFLSCPCEHMRLTFGSALTVDEGGLIPEGFGIDDPAGFSLPESDFSLIALAAKTLAYSLSVVKFHC